jgi:hypothetical protein
MAAVRPPTVGSGRILSIVDGDPSQVSASFVPRACRALAAGRRQRISRVRPDPDQREPTCARVPSFASSSHSSS